MKLKKILCPTDFSEHSEMALRYAIELTQGRDAQIDVVHVFEAPLYVAPLGMPHSPEAGTALVGRLHADLNERLAQLAADAGGTGVQIEDRMLEGVVHDEIARLSADYDLIVLATHGRHGIERLVLGSVTARVLARAQCPVLTLPIPK